MLIFDFKFNLDISEIMRLQTRSGGTVYPCPNAVHQGTVAPSKNTWFNEKDFQNSRFREYDGIRQVLKTYKEINEPFLLYFALKRIYNRFSGRVVSVLCSYSVLMSW